MKSEWYSLKQVPSHLKKIGPIVVLDNLRAHLCDELSKTRYHFLPPYSPFLNLAEPINRDHKLGIRKLMRYYRVIPNHLENVHRGGKGKQRVYFTQLLAHICWNEIPDNSLFVIGNLLNLYTFQCV